MDTKLQKVGHTAGRFVQKKGMRRLADVASRTHMQMKVYRILYMRRSYDACGVCGNRV